MTKAEQVFEKIAKNDEDFSLKELAYGTAGGSVGALLTQPVDTVSNIGQKTGHGIIKTIKSLNAEALQDVSKSAGPAAKAFKIFKRYNAGMGAKILKIGPATGIAWATANYLKNKFD